MFSIQRAADGAASVAARLLRYLPATAAHSTNAANSSTISGIDFEDGKGALRRGWLTPVARPAVGLLLGLALVAGGAGALPVAAFGEEAGEVAVLTARLDENGNASVGSVEDLETVLCKIGSSDLEQFTITVTNSLGDVDASFLAGFDDKTVTFCGQGEDNVPYIQVEEDVISLAGNVSFENILVSSSTIYANGHKLVLGKGFGGGEKGDSRMTVYGGADGDLDLAGGSTSVTVLDGVYKLIAGGNSAGTLTGNTYVEFGSDAKFPTAADGKQDGDYLSASDSGWNLYQDAIIESEWVGSGGVSQLKSVTKRGVIPYGIYGGGIDADTMGSTTVEMTGGEVYQIFGGGAATWNPTYAEQNSRQGMVSGNTSVHVSAGEVKSIYGGGYNGVDAYRDDEYDRKPPEEARSTRAVVTGTAYLTIDGTAYVPACEQSEDPSSTGPDPAAVHGGSFHSTVSATEVVVGGEARIETGGANNTTGYGYGSLFGAGTNDIVLGTTSVTLKDSARIGSDKNALNTSSTLTQGACGSMTPLGYAAQHYIGGISIGYGSEILNLGNATYGATATVEGGQVDVLTIGNKSRNTSQASKSVQGNVLLQQTDGTIAAIEASCIADKNVDVSGNVDVKVSGGTVQNYIMGKYDSSHTTDKVIGGEATLELFSAATDSYHAVPLIENMDSVTVKAGAKIAIAGDWTVNDYKGKYGVTNPDPDHMNPVSDIPFYQVEELTVEEGAALAISQEHALIEGDITIDGQLEIKRSSDGVEAPLTAEGTASGKGSLLPFEGAKYGTGSLPKVDEEYVYAQKSDSTMNLTLANAGDTGLYVDIRDKEGSTDRSAWYIAKGEPEEQLWYYEVYYELIDEDGASEWVLYEHGQGGWALPDDTVSIKHEDFDGTEFDWEAVDGSGNETLGTHYVYDENYPTGETSHRLSATCAEATKDNPLKIYYRAAPHTVTYEFKGDAPSYVELPADQSTCYSAPITVAEEPAAPGWEFKGWTSDDVTIKDGGFTMPNDDVTITGTWERTAEALTPTATSLVAYEGGDGSSANPDDALPEPVWRFESEGWTLYFDGKEQPEGTDAFNWAYFPEEGDAEQTNAATKGVYELRAWPLDSDVEVMAKAEGGTYYYLDLTSEQVVKDAADNDVTVRVRDVTDDDAAENLAPKVFKPVYGEDTSHVVTRSAIQDGACGTSEAHAHVADGVTFEINGIDGLAVADDANISLLFDDFIPDVLGQSDRMDVLDGKARTAAGGAFATSENVETEFRYMDLVDTTNGNVWVAPADESAVTVFMPYTDSMTAESEIAVVHFDNLTRDYTVDLESADLDAEVAGTTAHLLTVTKADGGIVFEVPYREFGPFEIMWMNEAEEPDDPDTPKPPVIDPDDPGKPDPDPDDPDTPDEPDTPEPDDPDEPDTPEPDEPDTPDEPDEPDTPDAPKPDEPDTPDTPDTPEPSEPGTPEASEPAKPSNPEATIPQTGDALGAVAAASSLAGAGVLGAGVAMRRRRK